MFLIEFRINPNHINDLPNITRLFRSQSAQVPRNEIGASVCEDGSGRGGASLTGTCRLASGVAENCSDLKALISSRVVLESRLFLLRLHDISEELKARWLVQGG